MDKRILVILGHPSKKSLNHKLFKQYIKGAKASGAKVKSLILSDLNFNISLKDGYKNDYKNLEPDLQKAQKLIQWCEHLVIVTPQWWGSVPAVLKGFLDRVFLPGFAFKFHRGQKSPIPEQLLKGRSARIIMTMGSPKYVTYIPHFNTGINSIKRSVLHFCGFSPVKATKICSVDKKNEEQINSYLDEIYKLGKNLK